jgi:hypothetical protein
LYGVDRRGLASIGQRTLFGTLHISDILSAFVSVLNFIGGLSPFCLSMGDLYSGIAPAISFPVHHFILAMSVEVILVNTSEFPPFEHALFGPIDQNPCASANPCRF